MCVCVLKIAVFGRRKRLKQGICGARPVPWTNSNSGMASLPMGPPEGGMRPAIAVLKSSGVRADCCE